MKTPSSSAAVPPPGDGKRKIQSVLNVFTMFPQKGCLHCQMIMEGSHPKDLPAHKHTK